MKNDMRALNCIIQNLTGTRGNASTPIKDKSGNTLLDINEQDLCWSENFKDTLNQSDPAFTHNFSMANSFKELTLNLGEITTRETWDAINLQKKKNSKAASLG